MVVVRYYLTNKQWEWCGHNYDPLVPVCKELSSWTPESGASGGYEAIDGPSISARNILYPELQVEVEVAWNAQRGRGDRQSNSESCRIGRQRAPMEASCHNGTHVGFFHLRPCSHTLFTSSSLWLRCLAYYHGNGRWISIHDPQSLQDVQYVHWQFLQTWIARVEFGVIFFI